DDRRGPALHRRSALGGDRAGNRALPHRDRGESDRRRAARSSRPAPEARPRMSVPVLRVSNLSVAYPAGAGWLRAIDDVSFDVAEGRALGVVGESGSGKSTRALAVLGLLAPEARVESGAAQFKGESLFDLPEAARRNLRGNRISIVFQDPFTSLNPALPVGRQIAEPLVWHKGMDAAAAATEVERLLAEVGIARPREVALAYPHQLSGGMKQRALIATALACSPELLILDEPTTALDVTIEAQILDLLESLRRSRGLSMLYITHNLGVVARICDDVCVLYAGRVVEQGATAAVLETPRHPYTKGLLASLPRVTERKHRLAPIAGRFPDLTAPPPGCIFHPRCSFVRDRCKIEPQVLADGVRCWRAAELAGERWRVEEDSIPAHAGKGEGALVEVKDLAKTFQIGGMFDGFKVDFSGGFPLKFEPPSVRAVDGVSLSVSPGEVLGLVGESGCGKSTLGRMLVGLIEPSAGEIRIAGGSPQSQRRAAQIIFQNPDS